MGKEFRPWRSFFFFVFPVVVGKAGQSVGSGEWDLDPDFSKYGSFVLLMQTIPVELNPAC